MSEYMGMSLIEGEGFPRVFAFESEVNPGAWYVVSPGDLTALTFPVHDEDHGRAMLLLALIDSNPSPCDGLPWWKVERGATP